MTVELGWWIGWGVVVWCVLAAPAVLLLGRFAANQEKSPQGDTRRD